MWHFQGRSYRNGNAYFLSVFCCIRQTVELESTSLFNHSSSALEFTPNIDGREGRNVIVTGEGVTILNEAIGAYFKILLWSYDRRAKRQTAYLIIRPRF